MVAKAIKAMKRRDILEKMDPIIKKYIQEKRNSAFKLARSKWLPEQLNAFHKRIAAKKKLSRQRKKFKMFEEEEEEEEGEEEEGDKEKAH